MEVDVSSELLTTVEVVNARGESCDTSVKYSWKPSKCSSCQVFGHSDNGCPKRVREAVGTREPQPTQTSNTPPLTNVLRREAPSVVPIVIGLQGQSSAKTQLGEKGTLPSPSQVDSSPVGPRPGDKVTSPDKKSGSP